jgi:hypothetical protein
LQGCIQAQEVIMATTFPDRTARVVQEVFVLALVAGVILALPWALDLLSRLVGG